VLSLTLIGSAHKTTRPRPRPHPSIDDARGWYDSPAYQEILHLRTDHIDGDTLLVEGVAPDYDVHHTAEAFRQALASAT